VLLWLDICICLQALLQQQQAELHKLKLQQDERRATLQQLQERQGQQQPHAAAAVADAAPAAVAASDAAASTEQQQQQDEDVEMRNAQATEQQQQQGSKIAAEKDVSPAATEDSLPATRSSAHRIAGKDSTKKPKQKLSSKPRAAGRRNAKVLVSSDEGSDEDHQIMSSSSSDSDEDMVKTQRQSSRKRRQQQQQHGGGGIDTDIAPAALPSAAALAKQGQQLQQRQQQLDYALQDWQLQAAKVNEAALERDLHALQALAAAHAQLQQLQQQQDEAMAVHEELLDERYAKLLAVLQALNAALDAVYRQLTSGCGSAYCAYTQVRLMPPESVCYSDAIVPRRWHEQCRAGIRAVGTHAPPSVTSQ
jgi:hypothetical protein